MGHPLRRVSTAKALVRSHFFLGLISALERWPDLASAMKYNPNLRVLLTGGYFDVATPYCEGRYEMQHLKIPQKLQANIEYHYYQSGHMVYAHQASLKAIHDDVAAFIKKTDNLDRKP